MKQITAGDVGAVAEAQELLSELQKRFKEPNSSATLYLWHAGRPQNLRLGFSISLIAFAHFLIEAKGGFLRAFRNPKFFEIGFRRTEATSSAPQPPVD